MWFVDDKRFMKLKNIQKTFHEELDVLYGEEEVKSFFFLLLDAYLEVSRLDLVMNPDYEVEDVSKLNEAIVALTQHKPIQYILGNTEFYGLVFNVNENVLIPRPETEELVEWVRSEVLNKTNDELRILDIGTGSGCIAVSLASHVKNAKVYALDVSEGALEIAKTNAKLNNVEVEFIKTDILTCNYEELFSGSIKFDVIVSNPPYVRNLEKDLMKPNVLENEPHLALFVENENPLQFYTAITDFAKKNLKNQGYLFFEINEYLGEEMIELLKNSNLKNIELKSDIFKKDRMIKGQVINE